MKTMSFDLNSLPAEGRALLLVRGLPGSGKSTCARSLVPLAWKHVEADQYFEDSEGYYFDGSKLREAHQWCYDTAWRLVLRGNRVVVSNTFTRRWEMKDYRDFCTEQRIPCGIHVCKGEYGSIHDVPPAVMVAMKERWEDEPR